MTFAECRSGKQPSAQWSAIGGNLDGAWSVSPVAFRARAATGKRKMIGVNNVEKHLNYDFDEIF